MLRLRALLAILLAVTWCSAAWHVDLEAAGMLFQHDHRGHDHHHSDHGPVDAHDHHEQVFARDVMKDQVRASPATVASFAFLAFAIWVIAAARPSIAALRTLRERRETDPPLGLVWHFVQRCAPESAAPPTLA
jgi:hypothetical protein